MNDQDDTSSGEHYHHQQKNQLFGMNNSNSCSEDSNMSCSEKMVSDRCIPKRIGPKQTARKHTSNFYSLSLSKPNGNKDSNVIQNNLDTFKNQNNSESRNFLKVAHKATARKSTTDYNLILKQTARKSSDLLLFVFVCFLLFLLLL
jgi:hypothetical protein